MRADTAKIRTCLSRNAATQLKNYVSEMPEKFYGQQMTVSSMYST